MTLKLRRGLWLWAGTLALVLLGIIPLDAGLRATAALAVIACVVLAWTRAGRHRAQLADSLTLAEGVCLPEAAYRQPVVLVCGDGLVGLFGAVAAGQLAVRNTGQGCYVRVPDLERLPNTVASIEALRPDWAGQLSVMFIVNPGEHTDNATLAGRVHSFCYQLALLRKRGMTLPLLLVSYLHAPKGAGTWFSWETGHTDPCVRETGTCISLGDWQRSAAYDPPYTGRMHSSVRLQSAAAWLSETLLPELMQRDLRHAVGLPLACAITLVPVLPHSLSGNLWQRWLRDHTALIEAEPDGVGQGTLLPFPDPLLPLLPARTRITPSGRAAVLALWLFALAGFFAMASSAWQNTLLLRQVSDDLRRYSAIPEPARRDQPEFFRREDAMAALREDGRRLDDYYRNGAPLALGFGLYRGDYLRLPVLDAVALHREPAAPTVPARVPTPVRLDSLSLFSTGSAQLKPESAKVLIAALVDIKAQPGWLIVITGHTDATGNAEHNLQLSRARAAAVRDWMQRMGDIPDSCFAVQGFGASQPVASNDSDTGRTANRRVDIRLIPEVGACALPTAVPDSNPVAARDSQ